MDRSAILSHVHSSLNDIPLHVIVGRAYYFHVRSRLFLCIVNNCAKGLHFSAFIILWLYMYGILNCVHQLRVKKEILAISA